MDLNIPRLHSLVNRLFIGLVVLFTVSSSRGFTRDEIAEQWNTTLNMIDGYKYFVDNPENLAVIIKFPVMVIDMVYEVFPDDIRGIIDQSAYVSTLFLNHYMKLAEFFRDMSRRGIEYDRKAIEETIWSRWEFKKHQEFIEEVQDVSSLKLDFGEMLKGMSWMTNKCKEQCGRIPAVYKAIKSFEGLKYSQLPRNKHLFKHTSHYLEGDEYQFFFWITLVIAVVFNFVYWYYND
uniref:Transmembrane protein n=1 Tax=Caenorhabditis tropicalis TaxID=1561998 RepID=A0A1I7URF1_9PELO